MKKNVIFVMNWVKFNLELNLQITPNGFFVVKNAGILFQKKINILMEGRESHNLKKIGKLDKKNSQNI